MRTRCGTGKCILVLGLAALLAGCGADPEPEPSPAAVRKPPPPPMKPPAPEPVMPPPPAVAAKPDTAPPLKPPPEPPKPPAYVPPPMKAATADPEASVVNFRFLTMDHLKAFVLVNGDRVTDTPCLWGFSHSYEFDSRIPVTDWPPKGAAFVASETLRGPDGIAYSRVELALDGGLYDLAGQDRIKKSFPHLEPREMILYVNALILDKSRRGALRLKLVGEDGGVYRYTNFTPLQSVEDEMSSRYRRAIWFQRERSE